MAEFLMPSLGADMDVGTVTEWLVKPGDRVHRGDVVAVVDTTKSAVEVECFDSGTVERLLVPEGTAVPVGTPLAVIGTTDGQPKPSPEPAPRPVPEPARPPRSAAGTEPVTEVRAAPGRIAESVPAPGPQVSPIVRHMAKLAGVDLAGVRGTGSDGEITRKDVDRAAQAAHRPAPGGRPISPYARTLAAELGVDPSVVGGSGPVTAAQVREIAATAPQMRTQPTQLAESARQATEVPAEAGRSPSTVDNRTVVAELMAKANREIPHYHLAATIDLHRALTWLREHNRAVPVSDRVLPVALLLKATAMAARAVPELNGHWLDGHLRPSSTVDLGMAVAVRGGGLLVPVLTNADTMQLAELMRVVRDQGARARVGRPRGSDLAVASITVTNLGDLGVEAVHGVIHPPQVALVGFGAIQERPWAVDGLLGVRPLVTATLAADHRATDGATGARLLNTLDRLLQQPEDLW